jgi:hypothetical protein
VAEDGQKQDRTRERGGMGVDRGTGGMGMMMSAAGRHDSAGPCASSTTTGTSTPPHTPRKHSLWFACETCAITTPPALSLLLCPPSSTP